MTARVFVTGATGVLGRRVVRQLVDQGYTVTGVARSDEKADWLRNAGATPARVDLFDRAEVRAALTGHDAVAQLATHIPTGPAAAEVTAWHENDEVRSKAAPLIAEAAVDAGVRRFVQESITFPYVDGGEEWIDESWERVYPPTQQCVATAEQAAADLTAAGVAAVVLRFCLFMAGDSAHTVGHVGAARHGRFGLTGDLDGYVSLVHADDAAAAVVAALDVPPGVYNVAEPSPLRRSDHYAALARLAGRDELALPDRPKEKVHGQLADSLARSHRISSQKLQSASAWRPRYETVGHWGEPAA